MAYRVFGDSEADGCRTLKRIRVQRIVFEDDANIDASTTITAPLGTVIDENTGTILSPYRIEKQRPISLNVRIDNGNVVVEGLIFGVFDDFQNGGGAPCPQVQNQEFVIPVLHTIPANIKSRCRYETDSYIKEYDFNAVGYPDNENPGKNLILINVNIFVEICVTRPENVEC